jgi:hypothetical protein
VAQWLLADRKDGTEEFKSLIEKLQQRQRGRLAGMSPEERKTCKHTKNLMRHKRLAGISYREFHLTSDIFSLFLSRKPDEIKQNYISHLMTVVKNRNM